MNHDNYDNNHRCNHFHSQCMLMYNYLNKYLYNLNRIRFLLYKM